ncbi:MAG: ribonuclease HII [Verrucomicrobiota bacterium]|nr:MAG: ribonuclease HII [Verrucomicrobiota bacterium]
MGCVNERIEFDRQFFNQFPVLIGIDEAGRGPLAGPVVVCGVSIHKDHFNNIARLDWIEDIDDSKKLSPRKREGLFEKLLELRNQHILDFITCGIDAATIDRINILAATTQGMIRVVERLFTKNKAEEILIDGNPIKNFPFPHRGIVGGDGKSACIAIASIIAKVTRDHIMTAFDRKYSVYNFAQHKGYGTAAHIQAIRTYGLSPIHRQTFCRKFLA